MTEAHGTDARSMFFDRLDLLWNAAGNPKNIVIAQEARLRRGDRSLSEWRNRKHVPHDQAGFSRVVQVLINRVPPSRRSNNPIFQPENWQLWRRAAIQLKQPSPNKRSSEDSDSRAALPPSPLEPLESWLPALDVSADDLPAAAAWSRRWMGTPAGHALSDTPAPAHYQPSAKLRSFLADHFDFLEPTRLLASSTYISESKINRWYRAHRQEIGQPADTTLSAAERFLLLHEHFNQLGQVLSLPLWHLTNSDATGLAPSRLLYFTGLYRLAPAHLDAAAEDPRWFVHNILGAPDPHKLPEIIWQSKEDELVMSRKHLAIESHSVMALLAAATGAEVKLRGFAAADLGHDGALRLQPAVASISRR